MPSVFLPAWQYWCAELARVSQGPRRLSPSFVHQARVALKHLRAIDAVLGGGQRQHLASWSAALSPLRELDVVLECAWELKRAPEFKRFLQKIRSRRKAELARLRSIHFAPPRPLSPGAPKAVKKLRRRVRRLEKICREGGTSGDFHEWRKRMKRFEFVLEAMGKRAPKQSKITSTLGDAHDLDRLCEHWVAEVGRPTPHLSRLRRRADRLRARALA